MTAPNATTVNALAQCTNCGSPIETTTWHPALIRQNGDRRLFTFCDRECRECWRTTTNP